MANKKRGYPLSHQAAGAPPSFKPLNATQEETYKQFPTYDVSVLAGAAGTGKSFLALAMAVSRSPLPILIIRPPIEATSRSIGHLPGDLDEKLAPYMAPLAALLPKISKGTSPPPLKVVSLAHARGLTFENCTVIIDEAQNLTLREFILILSRLGPNAKLIFSGDPDQADIRPTQPSFITDFDCFIDRLWGKPGILISEFDDTEIVRHPLLHTWLKALTPPPKQA